MSAIEWPQTSVWGGNGMVDKDLWHEVELDSIPTYLSKCPVCRALIEDWFDRAEHKAWHEGLGR